MFVHAIALKHACMCSLFEEGQKVFSGGIEGRRFGMTAIDTVRKA